MSSAVLPLISLLTGFLFSTVAFSQTTEKQIETSPYLNQAVILQYHHVSSLSPASTSVTPEQFAQHIALIKTLGFQVKPLAYVINKIQSGKAFEQKTLAITFDDGYDSIYLEGFPQLKAQGWPFTVFISPKAIEDGYGNSMTWTHLKEMQDHGATIANHSWQHLHLLQKQRNETQQDWKQRISDDIALAQTKIKQELGSENTLFAYPYGEFDESLKQLLKEQGYTAFSQQSGPINHTSDFQALPRFPASGIYANTDTLKTKLNSLAFTITEYSPHHEIRYEDQPAPQLTLTIDAKDIHHSQIQCFYMGQAIPTSMQEENGQLIITTQYPGSLTKGRSRYNCTAPSLTAKDYYWFSMPFITLDEQRQWAN